MKLIFLIFTMLFSGSLLAESTEVTISCGRAEGSRSARFYEAIYKEIFTSLNVKYQIKYYPSKRSLATADSGDTDADAGRILNLHKGGKWQNLVRVDEPIFSEPFEAWTSKKDIKITSWGDLKPYKVARVIGIKFSENNIPKETKQFPVPKVGNGIKMVESGRADIFVFGRSLIRDVKEKENIGKDLHMAGVTGELVLYPYFHKKHSALIPKVEAELKKLKASGKYQKIYDEIIGKS